MSKLLERIREEVLFLLNDYSFTAREGAYLEGESVAVEIVPKNWSEVFLCDLHFRVIPACISTDVPAEVLAGAHKAAIEAQFHRNPNVRFAATHFLKGLREERISQSDLEGMNVLLNFKDAGDEEIPLEGITDRNGEIWFRDVLDTALCSLTIRPSGPPPPPPPPPFDDIIAETQGVSVTAESSSGPPLEIQPGSKHLLVYLADRRIVAVLEEIIGGNAVLTVGTRAEEFEGATVRFEWGDERGAITLEPSTTPETWSGQRKLDESFRKLISAVPAFEVLPRQQED